MPRYAAASELGSLEKEEPFSSSQHEAPRGKPVVSRLSQPLANAIMHSAFLMSYIYVATYSWRLTQPPYSSIFSLLPTEGKFADLFTA